MQNIMAEMSRDWDYRDCIAATDAWFRELKQPKINFNSFNRIAESITESQSAYEVSGFKMGFKAAMMLLENNFKS